MRAKWPVCTRTLGHRFSTDAKSLRVRCSFGRAGEPTIWRQNDRREIRRCGPTRVRVLMHKYISHVQPSSRMKSAERGLAGGRE